MLTRVATSPSRICDARRAPAALLSPEDSTMPDLRRLGCLVLEVNAVPMPLDAPTRERDISLVFALLRIERVTETITKEGEAQHRQTDRQHGEEKHVRIGLDVSRITPFGDHLAPTCLWWSNADTDETECRFGEDGGWNTERQCHDDRR